jgi:hypothetical protein
VAGAKTFRSTAELPFPNLAWSVGRDLPNFEFRITRPPVLGGSEWTNERQRITYLPFALSLALEFKKQRLSSLVCVFGKDAKLKR